jgi:hypothetical protein
MTAVDKVWGLIEAYGMLIGMVLGLVVVVATVGLSLWRRELRWTGVILGSVGIVLVAFSLWLSRDQDLSKRRSVQPRASELFTRLEYASEKLRVTSSTRPVARIPARRSLFLTWRPSPSVRTRLASWSGR